MDNKVILLVEDNPRDEALTLRALRKGNILNEIVVARDGVEALDYIFGRGKYADRDVGERPQLVLLDLKLPKMDGFEFMDQLRGRPDWREIPVVVITAKDLTGGDRNRLNGGVERIIQKSNRDEMLRQLSREIRKCVKRRSTGVV